MSVEIYCSFCGKSNEIVEQMICGPGGINICNKCTSVCERIISKASESDGTDIPSVLRYC